MKKKLLLAALCMLFGGCSFFEAQKEAPPAAEYFVHEIEHQHETLSQIAQWYTGNAKNWKLIAGHNPKLSPTKLRERDKVLIPAGLVMNPKKLPREFVKVPVEPGSPAEGAETSAAEDAPEGEPLPQASPDADKRDKIIENLLGK